MPSPTRIGRLLRRWRREHGSLEAMAPRLGVNKNTLAMYERGERLPGVDFLARFSRDLEVSFDDLLAERLLSSPEPAAQAFAAAPQGEAGAGYLPVPLLRAGGQGEEAPGGPAAPLAFSQDWLVKELGVEPGRAAYLEMDGDAMEPTLRAGSLLLVDCGAGERPGWEGICVLHLDGELLVKRVQRLPDRRIKVSSDNPAYEDFLLPLDGTDPELEVVGQVVWAGRRL